MKLLRAIKLSHEGKDKMLKIKRYSLFAIWDPDDDQEWKDYAEARNVLSNHKIIEKLLKLINYI